MTENEEFAVVELSELIWPPHLRLPSTRFRLLVAADTENVPADAVSAFAGSALRAGMVYLCVWGIGCSRFHDIVDETIVADELGERRFVGGNDDDVIMTSWHDDESLEEALDYLAICAYPTASFVADSHFRLVMCVRNSEWSRTSREFLKAADFFA